MYFNDDLYQSAWQFRSVIGLLCVCTCVPVCVHVCACVRARVPVWRLVKHARVRARVPVWMRACVHMRPCACVSAIFVTWRKCFYIRCRYAGSECRSAVIKAELGADQHATVIQPVWPRASFDTTEQLTNENTGLRSCVSTYSVS